MADEPKKRPYKPTGPIPAEPCLTTEAASKMQPLVTGKEVFEFGSGGSTLWLAKLASKVQSIEDDLDWYVAVHEQLIELDALDRVSISLVKTDEIHNTIYGQWDVVFVDPRKQIERKLSILGSIDHVKPGGWMVVDDYNFPMVAEGVGSLKELGWEIEVLAGKKMSPVRDLMVNTSTAFCRKPA